MTQSGGGGVGTSAHVILFLWSALPLHLTQPQSIEFLPHVSPLVPRPSGLYRWGWAPLTHSLCIYLDQRTEKICACDWLCLSVYIFFFFVFMACDTAHSLCLKMLSVLNCLFCLGLGPLWTDPWKPLFCDFGDLGKWDSRPGPCQVLPFWRDAAWTVSWSWATQWPSRRGHRNMRIWT